MRKQYERNEIVRYKTRFVAQGFSERPDVYYEETYSPIMDAVNFLYLIRLAVHENRAIYLMDVVTTYLYGSLDMKFI